MRWHDPAFKLRCERTVVTDVTTSLERGFDGYGVMGAVCSDPVIAQKLVAGGVPVWYLLRSHETGMLQIEGRAPVEFTEPDGVETSQRNVGSDVRCRVQAGEHHLSAISVESEAVMDIERVPSGVAFGLDIEDEPQGSSRKARSRGRQGTVFLH